MKLKQYYSVARTKLKIFIYEHPAISTAVVASGGIAAGAYGGPAGTVAWNWLLSWF